MPRLHDKIALVTGAARGIGAAIARAFIAEGARVMLTVIDISGAAAYASSKAGVRDPAKSVALYWAEQRLAIRCNSIHPAAIRSPMREPLLGDGLDHDAIDGRSAREPDRRPRAQVIHE